jgi:hypothetical protein
MADIIKIPKLFAGGHVSLEAKKTYTVLFYSVIFNSIIFLWISRSVIHPDLGGLLIKDLDPAWTFLWTLEKKFCQIGTGYPVENNSLKLKFELEISWNL